MKMYLSLAYAFRRLPPQPSPKVKGLVKFQVYLRTPVLQNCFDESVMQISLVYFAAISVRFAYAMLRPHRRNLLSLP